MKNGIDKIKIINIFIRFFILGAVFLLPLVFDAFSFLDNVFIYPKIFILYTFIFSLLISTLIKIVYLKKIEINKRIFKHILWPSIYILTLLLISLFAFDVNKAIWGSYTRQFGFITHLFLYLWFVLLLFNLSLKPQIIKIREIYKVIVFSSFLVSIYAILQYFGIDFVHWKEAAINTKRAFSSLGQPNYLGLFLVMIIPIIFYLFKIEKNKYLRYFWLLSAIFSIAAWFMTSSRSAWLALIIIALVFLAFSLFKNKSIFKSKTFIFILLIISFLLLTLFSQPFFKDRINSSFNLSRGSVAIRLIYWQSAYDKIIQKPILGYGLEQQKYVLRDAYIKEWAVHEKLNTYSDRAHNLILDYLLIGGVLVLFIYFMMLRSWFIEALKTLRKNNYQIAILLLSFISYFITLFFSFEIITSSFYFWLFGALIIVGANRDKGGEQVYAVLNLKLPKQIRRVIVIFLLLLLFLFTYIQLQKIIANHYFLGSKQAGARGLYNESLLLYNYSKDTGYSHREYDSYFADSISYLLIENKQKPYLELELKLKDIESTLSLNTYDNFFVKARINSAIGEYEKANENYYQAISLSKNIPKTYLALANNYYLQKDFDKALKNYNLVIDKIPNPDNKGLNDEHRNQIARQLSMTWEKKGDLYFKQAQYNEAILAFKKAYSHNMYQVPILKKIADSYYFVDDINMAIWYNKKGKQRNSSDPAWSTALSWLYFKKGDIEEAEAQLQEALFIRPDYGSAIDLKKEFNFNF